MARERRLFNPLATTANPPDLQPVKIQLKWFHEFQFAGYYAALEKGFYTDEGLDVKLLVRNPSKTTSQSVLDGYADYGVADAGLFYLINHH